MPLATILHDWWTGEERDIRYRQLRNNGAEPILAKQARDFSPRRYGKLLFQLIRARNN